MQTNINLSSVSEEQLDIIRSVAYRNGKNGKNKADVIALAITIAHNCIENLDEESFVQVTNLKK